MATAELGFKQPLSKEEKVMKKKERLAAIGNAPLFGLSVRGSLILKGGLGFKFPEPSGLTKDT